VNFKKKGVVPGKNIFLFLKFVKEEK